MNIYKCVFTGEEVISSAFGVKEVGDILIEAHGKLITKSNDLGIPSNDEQQLDDGTESIIDIIDAFNLKPIDLNKKSFVPLIKEYMKKIKGHLEKANPSRLDAFMKGAQEFVKTVMKDFDEYSFYLGESSNPDGALILSKFGDDGLSQDFWYFKDGLKQEKV
eukprot:Anaeramoba_ignava/a5290_102.p1 GENE.a5290_102~~a5290_102.p1  ORF type:complete len:176 (+),score=64.15 a5290_102:44-529(+)